MANLDADDGVAEHGGDAAEMGGVGDPVPNFAVPNSAMPGRRAQEIGNGLPEAAAHAAPVSARSP